MDLDREYQTVELLQQLVGLPSVNPMARDDISPEIALEGRMTSFLANWFTEQGIDFRLQQVADGRQNIVGWVDGRSDLPAVVLDAHQDTVPVDGMTIPPFSAEIRDGRLWGRGACDIKGGMASMLTALSRVKNRPQRPRIVMSCTCDEELGQMGAKTLAETWNRESSPRDFPSRPDLAIVAEPTSLDVVVAHRGTARWRIAVSGRAAHSSQPDAGISAIYRMARLLNVLEEYAGVLGERVAVHPLCGPATLSVGRVHGGTSVNMVPDHCAIDIDRRVLPGENVAELLRDVEQYLQERLDFEFQMDPPTTMGMSLSNEINMPLAAQLGRSIDSVAGNHSQVGVAYTTHAPQFAAAGIPTVVFGPGSIAQAHTKDEWIDVRELEQATEILTHFLLHLGAPTGNQA
jgi:succinyl-diaminopimelate desuccinylase